MRIADVLRNKGSAVATIGPNTTVTELLTGLAELNIGAMVVVESDAVLGMVSERDVVRKLNELGAGLLEQPVSAIMTSLHVTCAPGDAAAWTGRELFAPCFKTDVAGATGAGDCTIAGFLAGILKGLTPEETVTRAVAVGAFSVEAPDATSGVPDWESVERRLAAGWERLPFEIRLEGWRESGGVWGQF